MNIEGLLVLSVLSNFTLACVLMTTASREDLTNIIHNAIADRVQPIVAEEMRRMVTAMYEEQQKYEKQNK